MNSKPNIEHLFWDVIVKPKLDAFFSNFADKADKNVPYDDKQLALLAGELKNYASEFEELAILLENIKNRVPSPQSVQPKPKNVTPR